MERVNSYHHLQFTFWGNGRCSSSHCARQVAPIVVVVVVVVVVVETSKMQFRRWNVASQIRNLHLVWGCEVVAAWTSSENIWHVDTFQAFFSSLAIVVVCCKSKRKSPSNLIFSHATSSPPPPLKDVAGKEHDYKNSKMEHNHKDLKFKQSHRHLNLWKGTWL